jgi:hypothetical protein
LRKVLGEEVGDFGGDFHARRAAAHDDDVQEFALPGVAGAREGGEFEELFDAGLQAFGVVDVADEVGVFDGAGGVECVWYATGRSSCQISCVLC